MTSERESPAPSASNARSSESGRLRLNLSTGSGLLAIVLWSSTIAVARSLSEQLGPITAAVSVYLIGGLFCVARLWVSKALARQVLHLSRKYLFGCGLLFVVYTVLLYVAIGLARDREQVLEIGLINYLWPAGTVVFSLWLLDKRANLLLLPGTVLALLGVFLVMTQGARMSWSSFVGHLQDNPVAYACAFAGAVAWALYSNLTRRWSEPGSEGAVELFIPATGVLLLLTRLLVTEPTAWNAQAVAEAILLGGVTAVAYVLWDVAMRKGDLLLVASCAYFTPLLSTGVSCAYLKVLPGSRLWVGAVLIVIGSLISWRSVSDKSRPAA